MWSPFIHHISCQWEISHCNRLKLFANALIATRTQRTFYFVSFFFSTFPRWSRAVWSSRIVINLLQCNIHICGRRWLENRCSVNCKRHCLSISCSYWNKLCLCTFFPDEMSSVTVSGMSLRYLCGGNNTVFFNFQI